MESYGIFLGEGGGGWGEALTFWSTYCISLQLDKLHGYRLATAFKCYND